MSASTKVIVFGVISGLIWSVIPGVVDLFDSAKESALVYFTGALTGLAVSLVLKGPVSRFGWGGTLIVGLISLPLGAFVFGVISSVISSFLHFNLNGFTDDKYGFSNVFLVGGEYALLSMISLFAIILFPLAVLTTFIFRIVIHSGHKSGKVI